MTAPADSEPTAGEVTVDPAQRRRCLTALIVTAVSVVVVDHLVKYWVVSTIKPRIESGEGPSSCWAGW